MSPFTAWQLAFILVGQIINWCFGSCAQVSRGNILPDKILRIAGSGLIELEGAAGGMLFSPWRPESLGLQVELRGLCASAWTEQRSKLRGFAEGREERKTSCVLPNLLGAHERHFTMLVEPVLMVLPN